MEVARKSDDLCDGSCGYPPAPPLTASPNVHANGMEVVRDTDFYAPHGPGKHASRRVVATSSKVFVNGLAIARRNDPIDCGAKISTGSPNVNAG